MTRSTNHELDTAGLHTLYASGHQLILPGAYAARVLGSRLRSCASLDASATVEPQAPLAWSEWLARCWSSLLLDGLDDRVLLNRLQENQLWVQVLEPDLPGTSPALLGDIATSARSALRFAANFRVTDRLRSEAGTASDNRVFLQALDRFQSACARQRLLPPALLEEALAQHVVASGFLLPETLHLIGFEEKTPAQTHLLSVLEEAGTSVQHVNVRAATTVRATRFSGVLATGSQQLRFAVDRIAEQARARPFEATATAVILAGDDIQRPELERLFRERLAPELESIHADLSSTPWQFAQLEPLRHLPVIAAALDCLSWTVRALPLERAGQLLLSPFFEHSEPAEARARFEAHRLRRSPALVAALDLRSFLSLALSINQARAASAAATHVRLSPFRALSRAAARFELATITHSHAEWADHVRKLLKTTGWPGPRALSPIEFQAVEDWEALLDRLSTLALHAPSVPFAGFLHLLLAEADRHRAPGRVWDAPVQVLTLQESQGLAFDLTVVLDATDTHLPAAQQPHPLLPAGLQHHLGYGDPSRSLEQTRSALASLSDRSGTLLLLAPAEKDHATAQLTPLATQLGFQPLPTSRLVVAEGITQAASTDLVQDGDALSPLTDCNPKGGADVLKLQASCSFRAFASLRLAAREDLQARELGLNERETGRVLHAALQSFWADVKSQAALRALTTEARRTLLRQTIEVALANLRPHPDAGDAWSERFLRILSDRFLKLLSRWLDAELERAPFEVIAQETQQTLALGPLRLTLRPDRIDKVEDGFVFVDYKTGYDLKADHWLDIRPEEPQLPAYALCADPDQVQGIAFGQIRPNYDKFGWISLSQQTGIFPKKRGKQVDMRDQVTTWRTELTGLAEEFAAGDVRVDPKKYPGSCQFCALRALCRIDPASLEQGDDEDLEITEEDETLA